MRCGGVLGGEPNVVGEAGWAMAAEGWTVGAVGAVVGEGMGVVGGGRMHIWGRHKLFEEIKCVGGEVTEVTNRVEVSLNEVLVEPCCCTMVI